MERILEGTRYNTLLAHARQAWEEGQNLEDVYADIAATNAEFCDPPLAITTVRKVIQHAAGQLMAAMDVAALMDALGAEADDQAAREIEKHEQFVAATNQALATAIIETEAHFQGAIASDTPAVGRKEVPQ